MIVFYHKDCPDGFGSAYVFWKKYGEAATYHPINHMDELPDVTGQDVYFVDIARGREQIEEISKVARSLTIIDHHLSNYNKLNDLPYFIYDVAKSGTTLCWKFCFPETPIPRLLKHIEDRDIHKWLMQDSEEVLTALDSLPYDFELWSVLEERLEKDSESVISEGKFTLRYCKTLIEKLKKKIFRVDFMGYNVPIINISFFANEILNDISVGEPFAMSYHFDGEYYIFSLRSDKEGVNVSELASRIEGGGGHEHAAGFSLPELTPELKGRI